MKYEKFKEAQEVLGKLERVNREMKEITKLQPDQKSYWIVYMNSFEDCNDCIYQLTKTQLINLKESILKDLLQEQAELEKQFDQI